MTPRELPTVSVDQAARETAQPGGQPDGGAVLLDVREHHEWVAGHAPAARHVPMSQLLGRLDELPRDRPLDVVCHLGGRSGQVAAYLLQQGFDARNVDGGMDAWERAGLPVVTDSGTPGRVV